jgi:hypothetical protein
VNIPRSDRIWGGIDWKDSKNLHFNENAKKSSQPTCKDSLGKIGRNIRSINHQRDGTKEEKGRRLSRLSRKSFRIT